MKNDFDTDLQFSEKASDEPFWDEVYKKAFPSMVNQMLCSGDTHSQRLGIDRIILLSSGRVIRIDEKKRRRSYNDILLEYISIDSNNTPGWIEKDLAIDYLAYAFMDKRRVYLFDWQMLRRAWINYKDEWLGKYKTVVAKNRTYNTYCLAVDIKELTKAVSRACIIQV